MALDFKFPAGFLLDGSDFQLSDAITFHHPSLSEVMCLGKRIYFEEVYWLYVSTLLADPYEHMVWLDDNGWIMSRFPRSQSLQCSGSLLRKLS